MTQGRGLPSALAIHHCIPGRGICYIKACEIKNINRGYKNRNIFILSDSQDAIKALDKHCINSMFVLDCHQSLTELAEHNRVQAIWVPGQRGIEGSEIANQLTKKGSKYSFI
jgi:ribonuclease HI